MGDKHRGRAVANYIRRKFPHVRRLISVADGNLMLAREIYQDYDVTIYDPEIRNKNSIVRQHVKVVGKPFTSGCSENCELIIGLHPDEATGEIIDYATQNQTPCVIIPCCVKGKYASDCSKAGWVKHLANILRQRGWQVYIDLLPINGDNLVIRGLPTHYRRI